MTFLDVLVRVLIVVFVLIVLVRINGLRSFSKMSSFDFALTVAAGSVVAGAITTSSSILPFIYALMLLFLVRFAISRLRMSFSAIGLLTDNAPLLLMRDGAFLEENMRTARVTKDDVVAKLREANALELANVRAVILESTGDVSVLHGSGDIDEVMQGVRTRGFTPDA